MGAARTRPDGTTTPAGEWHGGECLIAVDQGTTSTRAIAHDLAGRQIAVAQLEHDQILPRPGWVQQSAAQIWGNTRAVLIAVMERLAERGRPRPLAVGITDQRETTVLWDPTTGVPVHDAIVWQDTRTQPFVDALADRVGVDALRRTTGLPLHPYFSATKIAWLLEHVDGAADAARAGRLLAGTMDTWVLWNLTGGARGRRTVHATDVTNASRTLLFDITRLDWDDRALDLFGVPRALLPAVHPSVHAYGRVDARAAGLPGVLDGVPVTGVIGDQQSAALGQGGTRPGDAKNTYGTGSFLLVNTGDRPVFGWSAAGDDGPDAGAPAGGLLTTIAFRQEGRPAAYALEGSIPVTGSLVQWLRDGLGLIDHAADVEALARTVPDAAGVTIVPAFSGLYAPWWRPDARGVITGLTRYVTRGHLARAALEAIAHQCADVIEASGLEIAELRVDGGASRNDLLMQIQADLLGVPVQRLDTAETTALGAACAAGIGAGVWRDVDETRRLTVLGDRFEPAIDDVARRAARDRWRDAVPRSLGLA